MVIYGNPVRAGTDAVASIGDGSTINISWFQAYPTNPNNKILYNIYYSTIKEDVFTEGPKYLSYDGSLQANLIDLTPGQEYFLAVRPVECTSIFNPLLLPLAYDNLRIYPISILRQDISAIDTVIPLLDTSEFPSTGIIKVGVELIQYVSNDQTNNNLLVVGPTSNISPSLVSQGGQFYVPDSHNIGTGTFNNLATLFNNKAPTETWTIRCIFVQPDSMGNPLPNTAKFEAIGSVSGNVLNPYGDYYIWTADNNIVNNTILSFSIQETSIFHPGDQFIVKVSGFQAGNTGGRGYNNSLITIHTVSGFDGYNTWDPNVNFFVLGEDNQWDRIFACQSRFEYPNYAMTIIDGYKQVTKDLLSTDLAAADAANVGFPMYDYSGYHRTDPVLLLSGVCVGSYIGGQMGCIDGYGNSQILRGLSLQDQNTQRQDMELSVTGRQACLIKRSQTGIICSCYQPSSEYQDDRCPLCLGGRFVLSYEQYFNPRSSDGRITIRVYPTDENTKMYEAGLESELPFTAWTITVPTIKTRDILVLFDQDDNEEFRYEVISVSRNNTILGQEGAQIMRVQRIRKFDIAYQIRVFRNTAMFPAPITTTVSSTTGIPPHAHTIQSNEHDPSTWSQLTSVSQGHNHEVLIQNGVPVVQEILGHSHSIII